MMMMVMVMVMMMTVNSRKPIRAELADLPSIPTLTRQASGSAAKPPSASAPSAAASFDESARSKQSSLHSSAVVRWGVLSDTSSLQQTANSDMKRVILHQIFKEKTGKTIAEYDEEKRKEEEENRKKGKSADNDDMDEDDAGTSDKPATSSRKKKKDVKQLCEEEAEKIANRHRACHLQTSAVSNREQGASASAQGRREVRADQKSPASGETQLQSAAVDLLLHSTQCSKKVARIFSCQLFSLLISWIRCCIVW